MLLAIAVALVWVTNFAIVKIALAHLPPLLFATLRYVFAFIPAVFFVHRPLVAWRHLAVYGVLIGAGQFGLLYIAMERDISPGLASLVIQMQVFFTIALSMWLTAERVRMFQWVALALAATGLATIMAHGGHDVTPLGLGMVLTAAACWASGNIIARSHGGTNILAFVVWASLFSIPPLLALSLVFEGAPRIVAALRNTDLVTWASVIYQSAGNTLFGYAAWGWLLARHPAATVSPFALLVPVFGMATSAWLLGEPLQAWKIAAALLVLSGLALNLLWPRLAMQVSALRADRVHRP